MEKLISIDYKTAARGISSRTFRQSKQAFTSIGTTSLREIYQEDIEDDDKILKIDGASEADDSYYEVYEKYPLSITKGYLPVSANELIRVATRIPILIALGIIVLIFIIVFLLSNHVTQEERIFSQINSSIISSVHETASAGETMPVADDSAASDLSSSEEALAGSRDPTLTSETNTDENMTSIPVYPEIYVTEAQPDIPLNNPSENTVYFEYVIFSEDGSQLYKSDLISPGKYIEWDAYSDLTQGIHDITMQINCYDVSDKSPCNGSAVSCTIHCG